MQPVKKIAQRSCIGCHNVMSKKELIRIVKSPDGEFSIDTTGKKPGRGAYLCKKQECFDAAVKSHAFDRSFKTPVDQSTIKRLREELFN